MLTLREAIKKAEEARGSKVVYAKDCNDRWVFNFENDYPKEEVICDENLPDFVKRLIVFTDVIPTFVFKDDGRMEPFYISQYIDLLAKGTPIDLSKVTP